MQIMCIQDSVPSSSEEKVAPIEGLDIFCKPVEIYNFIDDRASRKQPLFLKRCLSYKVQEKYKGRIQMTVVLPVALNTKSKNPSVYPVCVLLGKEVSGHATTETQSMFHFGRARMLYTGTTEGANHARANFLVPKMDTLKKLDTASHSVIFISSAKLTQDCMDLSSFPCKFVTRSASQHLNLKHAWCPDKALLAVIANVEGDCLVGKMSIDLLSRIWTNTKSWSLGETAEMYSTVILHPHYLKSILSESGTPSFGLTPSGGAPAALKELQVVVSAWEIGATERNPYDSYAYNEIPNGSLPNLVRLRSGNVVFNYRQRDKKLLITEVTEDFSCPFCLMKCVSFKGLGCHLSASHDLFNFENSVTEEYQSVNVSPNFDTWSPKIVGHGVDPRNQTFFFRAKSLMHKQLHTVVRNAKHTHRPALDLDLLKAISERQCMMGGYSHTHADPDCLHSLPMISLAPPPMLQDDNTYFDCTNKPADPDSVQSVPGSCLPLLESLQHNIAFCGQYTYEDPNFVQSGLELQLPPPAELQHAKTRKEASVDDDSMKLKLMQEGKFFHSRSGQPMTLGEVLSDHNSEDEIDYDIEDIEDQRMLADFLDVSKDEKHMMHLWNSFVRRNRVRFGCHINWACEAFTQQHGRDFAKVQALLWCWRLFMIKLWNHGLLDAKTMNTCNIMLDKFHG